VSTDRMNYVPPPVSTIDGGRILGGYTGRMNGRAIDVPADMELTAEDQTKRRRNAAAMRLRLRAAFNEIGVTEADLNLDLQLEEGMTSVRRIAENADVDPSTVTRRRARLHRKIAEAFRLEDFVME